MIESFPLMADLAQLVRALVCGTRCREFESHNPPHLETSFRGRFFILRRFIDLPAQAK